MKDTNATLTPANEMGWRWHLERQRLELEANMGIVTLEIGLSLASVSRYRIELNVIRDTSLAAASEDMAESGGFQVIRLRQR